MRPSSDIIRDIGEGRFATSVAAVCMPRCSRVELLSAGHGPSSEERFEEIGAHGLPLGITLPFVSDPPKILELNLGDLLVLATDGFFEWTNTEGEPFGIERFEETIRRSKEKRKRPRELISALYGAVLAFSGGMKQQDDLTAGLIKRNEINGLGT